jgi:hypothetical protein
LWAADFTASGTDYAAGGITIGGYPGETVVISSGDQNIKFPSSPARSYIIIQDLVIDGSNYHGDQLVYMERNASHHIRMQRLEIRNSWQHMCAIGADHIELLNSVLHDTNLSGSPPPQGNAWYGANSYHLIDGNTFYNVAGAAIRFFDSGGGPSDFNIARNNTIRNFSTGAVAYGEGIIVGHQNNLIYNNVIYGGYGPGIQVSYNSPLNNKIYNNTIYSNQSYGIAIFAGSAGTIVRNNILYGNAANYQDLGTGTLEDHNLGVAAAVNPQFVNATGGNFTLQNGSPAIDAGATLTEVPIDMFGVPRPQGRAYDIGAFEFRTGLLPPTGLRVVQ